MPARIRSLYCDTSVIGGYFDDEWMDATRELLRQAEAARFRLVTSVVTAREIINAPPDVRGKFADAFGEEERILDLSEEAEALAQAYVAAGVVTPKYVDDARHVAIATVEGIGIVVSWNFRHLANLRREAGFNGVNLLRGWGTVRIVSPLELIHDDNEDETEDL